MAEDYGVAGVATEMPIIPVFLFPGYWPKNSFVFPFSRRDQENGWWRSRFRATRAADLAAAQKIDLFGEEHMQARVGTDHTDMRQREA